VRIECIVQVHIARWSTVNAQGNMTHVKVEQNRPPRLLG
jgi:hypothetical protein